MKVFRRKTQATGAWVHVFVFEIISLHCASRITLTTKVAFGPLSQVGGIPVHTSEPRCGAERASPLVTPLRVPPAITPDVVCNSPRDLVKGLNICKNFLGSPKATVQFSFLYRFLSQNTSYNYATEPSVLRRHTESRMFRGHATSGGAPLPK